jgi:hypothetical protein
MSRDETVSLSRKSNIDSRHRDLNGSPGCEHTANSSPPAAEQISTRGVKSIVGSVIDSYGVPHQSTRGQSPDLTAVKEVKEQVGGSQVRTSSVLQPGLPITEENTASTRHIQEDVTQLATSLEVSATTAGNSLTSVAVPIATVGRSNDDDRFVII